MHNTTDSVNPKYSTINGNMMYKKKNQANYHKNLFETTKNYLSPCKSCRIFIEQ